MEDFDVFDMLEATVASWFFAQDPFELGTQISRISTWDHGAVVDRAQAEIQWEGQWEGQYKCGIPKLVLLSTVCMAECWINTVNNETTIDTHVSLTFLHNFSLITRYILGRPSVNLTATAAIKGWPSDICWFFYLMFLRYPGVGCIIFHDTEADKLLED